MNRKLSKKQSKKQIQERPLDPTRNFTDMIGDSSGLTGITTGSAAQTSAEPEEINNNNTEHLPGGIMSDDIQTQPSGIPKTAQNNKAYNNAARKNMSAVAIQNALDIATEQEVAANQTIHPQSNNQNLSSKNNTATPPSIQGEQSVSGDMPDVESDDDTLENAHAAGFQLDEDEEHPQEIDIARDMDRAENEKLNT